MRSRPSKGPVIVSEGTLPTNTHLTLQRLEFLTSDGPADELLKYTYTETRKEKSETNDSVYSSGNQAVSSLHSLRNKSSNLNTFTSTVLETDTFKLSVAQGCMVRFPDN